MHYHVYLKESSRLIHYSGEAPESMREAVIAALAMMNHNISQPVAWYVLALPYDHYKLGRKVPSYSDIARYGVSEYSDLNSFNLYLDHPRP
jgi:hypothetical protein